MATGMLGYCLSGTVFIWFGNWFKSILVDIQKKPFLIAAVSLVIWGSTLFLAYAVDYSYMELAVRRYTLFPVCYITAIVGVVALSCISVMLTRFKIGEVLARLGGHSITLYMIHAIEIPFPMMYMLTDSNMLNTIVRVCIDIIMCIIIVYTTSHYKKVKIETWQIK